MDSKQKSDREEFEQNLHASIRGIKQLLDSVKLQIKTKGDPESIYQTKIKINELMNDLQESLNKMGEGFKQEAMECYAQVNSHK